jgi:hypothetical protein
VDLYEGTGGGTGAARQGIGDANQRIDFYLCAETSLNSAHPWALDLLAPITAGGSSFP